MLLFLLHLNHIKDDDNFETSLDSWKKKISPLIRNKILNNPNDKITTENKNLSADNTSKEDQNTEIKK